MNNSTLIDGRTSALWMHTAAQQPDTEPLESTQNCDVTVIGAGITGLNAALELVLNGYSVSVLDGGPLGFGASGRSGGQVNIGLNLGPKALQKKFGHDQAERLIHAAINTADTVFSLIKKHDLDCDPVQNGWIQGAAAKHHLNRQSALVREYEPYGDHFRLLDQSQLKAMSGTDRYIGGIFVPTAGSIHPLSYTRELARVCLSHGVQIYTHSKVISLQRSSDLWLVNTDKGQTRSAKVLICTNGYTDNLITGLRQTVVPVRSVLIASEPLPQAMREKILPKQVTFVDKRRLILYFRYDRDGRLCIGDHGPMRDAFTLKDFDNLKKRVTTVFPDLKKVNWDFHWGGRVAMTRDSLPFMHEILPDVIAGMGYNGRGVGMGTVMGKTLANTVRGIATNELTFPYVVPRRYPLHRFHAIGVSAAIKWSELMDNMETPNVPPQLN